jgi:hypothetical protein
MHAVVSRVRAGLRRFFSPKSFAAIAAIPALMVAGHYTVRPGDTLSSIAQRYCDSAADYPALAAASGIGDPNSIYVGERVTLDCRHAAAPAASPRDDVQTVSYAAPSGGIVGCIISRESGGDPTIVNPSSGAGGLFQFLPSTWASLGFSGLPEDASAATQWAAFDKEVALSGYSAWIAYDGC